ncbi:MAG TPA: hypothetical protein VK524_27970 [Polyangiaceae bacterium]|nr:hypothetical protein [Polyangiaceae bacterium]
MIPVSAAPNEMTFWVTKMVSASGSCSCAATMGFHGAAISIVTGKASHISA